MPDNRLARQIAFAVEIDKLKQVFRQTWLTDQTRHENDAEHSWHFATMVLLLSEYADPQIDRLRTVQMALLHDIVEIDAGDALVYDAAARAEKTNLEKIAAERIFGILPAEQAAEYRALWEEYEARQTADAKFAAAIDRLQPLLHNYYTQGRAWREHGVTADMVLRVNAHIADGSPRLWEYVQEMIADAVAKGYLAAGLAAQDMATLRDGHATQNRGTRNRGNCRMTEIAYIALGGNVGDVRATLDEALSMLDARADCCVTNVSLFLETEPVGGPADQPNYINAAAEVETDLSPEDLLAVLQEIEAELGRDRAAEQRWGPRTCDLDLLLYGRCVLETPELTIPHPRMAERRFVLEPLAEIAPAARHPVLDRTVAELLAGLATP